MLRAKTHRYELKVAKIQEDQEAKMLKEQSRRDQLQREELQRKKVSAAEKTAKDQARARGSSPSSSSSS